MCKPLDFEDSQHKILMNRIISGDIILFLGSGFSLGAVSCLEGEDNRKVPFPSVDELKKLLSKTVLYTEEVEGTLKDICEDCQEDNKARYAQIMRQLFKVYSVKEFHKQYTDIDWKKIFTVNVDNIVEYIYEDSKRKLCINYSENPNYMERERLPYYKLHGDAIKEPEKITFSTTDYVSSSARKNDCRFESLSQDLKTENFLFVGTSLNEEWDFDIQCQQSDIYTVRNKSYFVLNNYDKRLIKRLQRKFKNPVLIQETAESFIYKIKEYMRQYPIEKKCCLYEKWNFKQIKEQNYQVDNYLKPDLYLGEEPTWEDIFSNHDVIWEKTRKVINNLKKGEYPLCTLIVGKPISGKTTMLYRLGAMLCDSMVTLEYIGDNFWEDIKDYLKYSNESEDTLIILIDDANWILGRIDSIIGLIEDFNIKLIVTVREKEYEKRQHLFDEMILTKINIVRDINRLTREDIALYLDKLNEKSFLGHYSKDYHYSKELTAERLEKEIKGKKEDPLLRLTYKMKFGNHLDERINKISDLIIDNENYNLKRFLVLLYFLDVIGDTGLKLSLFLELYPLSNQMLNEFIIEIKDLLITNISEKSMRNSAYSKITIHGRFSEIIKKSIKKIKYEELEEIVEDIFRRIDNVYHFKSRQSNSYQNYVLYTLLRSQNISELFRVNNEGKISWRYINLLYENLHEYFGDYHLYWLHRGISEVKMKSFSAAIIHLEQARVTRQSYSYEIEHSFAMLYFEKAINSSDLSNFEREDMLEKALEIIRMQIGRNENDAFTIHSFIVKTIQYYRKIKQLVPDNLMKEILEYYYSARRRFNLEQSIIRRNMLMCIYQYLDKHNKIYDYNLSIEQDELLYVTRRVGNTKVNYEILDLL